MEQLDAARVVTPGGHGVRAAGGGDAGGVTETRRVLNRWARLQCAAPAHPNQLDSFIRGNQGVLFAV